MRHIGIAVASMLAMSGMASAETFEPRAVDEPLPDRRKRTTEPRVVAPLPEPKQHAGTKEAARRLRQMQRLADKATGK